jgi:hypothetical protein
MGDISRPKLEHLLVRIPYAVNDILDNVEKRFPYIKITVHPQQRVNKKIISEPIPDGRDSRRTQPRGAASNAKHIYGLQVSGRI